MKTLKKSLILTLLIALLICVFSVYVSAATYGDLTYTFPNGKVTITDCSTSTTSLTIPSTIYGYPVTGIGSSAFAYCSSLASVEIPNSVTSIGSGAFAYCSSLASVEIPNSVTSIGSSAFYNCTSLASITVDENNKNYSSDEYGVLYNKDKTTLIQYPIGNKRTSFEIPNSVTSIGSYAFEDCTSLASITVDENNKNYSSDEYGVLYNKDKTTLIQYPIGNKRTSFEIPNSVTSIGNDAFYNCDSLTNITIPDSVISIGSSAFYGCKNLTQINWNAKNINSFWSNNYVFAYAGQNGDGINVVFGDSVETIPEYAFYPYYGNYSYTPNIVSVTIGENVTSIDDYAFYNCKNLSQINWNAKNVTYCGGNVFYNIGQSDDGINVVFGDNVETIPANAFSGCDSLVSIEIPSSVTSIGSSAFHGCDSLTNITIPDSVTSIGSSAFKSCYNLKSVTIGENVTSIYDSAFYNCKNLTQINWNAKNVNDFNSYNYVFEYAGQNGDGINVVFGDSVETIPKYAFCPHSYSSEYTPNIVSVTIGENVTSIGYYAFEGCYNLTSITIPENVTSIDDYAFYNCKNLTQINWNAKNVNSFWKNNYVFAYAGQNVDGINVVFGDSVEAIPAYAFCPYSYSSEYTPNIVSVTIGENVTNIGSYAFYDCDSLTSINIPEKVTSIESYVFYSCDNLKSVTIGNSVTSIGSYAFYGCKNLSQINWNAKNVKDFSSSNYVFYNAGQNSAGLNVVFGGGVEEIPAYAFYDCDSLTSIIISERVTSIGNYAFYRCDSLTSINIPDSVISIDSYAFYGCGNLKSVTIGENVTSIGNSAFRDCLVLTQINWNAKNVADFNGGNYVFANAGIVNGVNVVFGDSVETIPANTFYPYPDYGDISYTPKIVSVTIGENVTSIGDYAFYNCSDLVNITIGNGVESIGLHAFTNTGYINDTANSVDGMFYIGNCLIDADESVASVTVKEDTAVIADGAFRNCTELLRVTLPESIVRIPDYAFYGCSNLLRITIPERVYYIGEYAFYDCDGINKINIPSSVTYMGNKAFDGCNNLEGVYITDINAWCKIEFGSDKYYSSYSNPLYIAGNLYINDVLAENIVITDNITHLNPDVFANCDSIKSVVLPESLTEIGESAFYSCSNLERINIPRKVTSIGENAFYSCYNLKDVYITDLSSWCNLSFNDYDQNPLNRGAKLYLNGELLETLAVPEDITILGNYAFYNCDSLKSVILHDGIEKIEEYVFYDCDNLKAVVIPENITYIKNNAFNSSGVSHVFFKGSSALWEDVLIYGGNDPINNATIVYDAREKTYHFETNCSDNFDDMTVYFLTDIPEPYNPSGYVVGWYENADFSGEAISFPYYGDATTLYARWKNRDGSDFKNAFNIDEETTVTVSIDTSEEVVYYKFVPSHSDIYHIYSTGNVDTRIYLYDSDFDEISFNDDGGENNNFHLKYNLVKGNTYYIGVDCFSGTGYSSMIVTSDDSLDEIEIPISGECGNLAKWKLFSDGSLIISGSGQMYNMDDYYDEYWREYKDILKNVVIGDDITRIGSYAFYNCDGITNITIGENVTKIGTNAFYGCTNLKIKGYDGSVAQSYALQNGIPFEVFNGKGYSITYDANGGTGAPDSQIKERNKTLALSKTKPTREGYAFLGWSVTANGNVNYAPGAKYTDNKSITLYAVWERIIIAEKKIALNTTKLGMIVGGTSSLTAVITPENATYKEIVWSSSDENVAVVDENGIITAFKSGKAKITATSHNGKKATCTVTIGEPATKVEFTSLKSTSLALGKSITLKAKASCEGKTKPVSTAVVFEIIEGDDIATIDAKGKLTAKGLGEVTVRARAEAGTEEAFADVTINICIPATKVTLNTTKASMALGYGDLELSATMLPADNTDTLTWSVDKPEIAEVDENGVVTAYTTGKVKVTAMTGSGKKATCTVTIGEPATKVVVTALKTTSVAVGKSITLKGKAACEGKTKPVSTAVVFDIIEGDDIATIDAKGKLTAKDEGTVVVRISAEAGTEDAYEDVEIRICNLATKVTLNMTKATIEVGDKLQLEAEMTAKTGECTDTLTWSVDKPAIASVDENGLVTAHSAGKVKVTATSGSGKKATCTITVTK